MKMSRRDVLLHSSVGALTLGLAPAALAGNATQTPRLSVDWGWTTDVERSGNDYTYRWEHRGRPVEIKVSLDPDKFIQSDALRRLIYEFPHEHGEYIEMAERDPYRKPFLSPVVEAIVAAARGREADPLFMLLTFVQGLPYKRESDYQSWPTETLINMHGSCSDTAVLYASLVEQYQAKRVSKIGKDPLWVFLASECGHKHLAVGLRSRPGRSYSGTYYSKGGFEWYVTETTGTGWQIGEQSCLDRATVLVPRSWS